MELANCFAAAVLMPYAAFLAEARATKYDLDHLATRFGVSFEQACHRATTLKREGAQGAQGVPLFFLRIDKGGNVSKRFNATDFHLAEDAGACPRLTSSSGFPAPSTARPGPVMRKTTGLPSPSAARCSPQQRSALPRGSQWPRRG